jgi:hypothetical protein
MKKALLLLAAAIVGAVFILLWQKTVAVRPESQQGASSGTWLGPDGRLKEGYRHAFNSGTDPTPLQTPTPFHRRMVDSGYIFDGHEGKWYQRDVAIGQYHCLYLWDGHIDVSHPELHTYLSCPKGHRPPGIADQKGNF